MNAHTRNSAYGRVVMRFSRVSRTSAHRVRLTLNGAKSRIQAAWWRVCRWYRLNIRHEQPPAMDAVWGRDDCWTFAFGETPRPAILCAPDENAAFQQAIRHYKNINNLIESIAGYMPDWKRIDLQANRKPGDIVMGATSESGFVIAKVDDAYLPIERRRSGYAVAIFIKTFAVYRRVL